MDELNEQPNEVPRVRRQYLTKQRVHQLGKNYADLVGINDHGKSATDYLRRFSGKDQIRILRYAEEELFPELYNSWFLIECYMDAEKTKRTNKEDTGKK